MNSDTPQIISDLADACGGTITECVNDLGDGSGFATMSIPLPEDHWLYVTDEKGFTPRPHYPMRAGGGSKARSYLSRIIAEHGGQYGVKCATSNGRIEDFDPDALVRNIEIGLFGVFTEDGLHSSDAGDFSVSDAELFNPLDTSPTLGKVLMEAVALAIHDGLLTFDDLEEATTPTGIEQAVARDAERDAQRQRDYEELAKRKGWAIATSCDETATCAPSDSQENGHE